MTGRLLLDEMFAPRIATELAARGHDCVAVAADPALRESSDAELLAYAAADQRTVVTNNVVDFERLRRQRAAAGEPTPPLIYTSDTTFPRDRRFVGRLITALDHACTSDAVAATGGSVLMAPTRRVTDLYGHLLDDRLDEVAAAPDAARDAARTFAQDHADCLRTNGQLIKLPRSLES